MSQVFIEEDLLKCYIQASKLLVCAVILAGVYMSKKLILLVIGIFLGVLGGTSYFLMSQLQTTEIEYGRMLSKARDIAPFTLQDQFGQEFTEQRLKGKWSLVTFGFTNCPDVCPTAMASFRDEIKLLDEQKSSVQFIFVSVDPERDTPEVLRDYSAYFHPDIIALTGKLPELKNLASNLSVHFQKQGSGDKYTMAHSPQFFLIDPQGKWTAMYTPPLARGKIAMDLSRVVSSRIF